MSGRIGSRIGTVGGAIGSRSDATSKNRIYVVIWGLGGMKISRLGERVTIGIAVKVTENQTEVVPGPCPGRGGVTFRAGAFVVAEV